MPTIQVNNTTLSYQEFGTGSKVLLSTQNFFLPGCHMELLAKPPYDYHVYLVTMRGYGGSEHVHENFARNWTTIWGEDLLAFADAIGAEQFYYTGVSHGCFAGWHTALTQPHRLRGFVPTSGVLQYHRPDAPAPLPKQEFDVKEIVGNREALAKMAWNETYPLSGENQAKRRAFNHQAHLDILMNRKEEEFLVENTHFAGFDAADEAAFYARLSTIVAPVLIACGMLDRLATPEASVKAAAAIPGAQLLCFQNLGHGGPDECPELFARVCHRFFTDLETPMW